MFERELVELVTISKSARKLNVVPWKHVVSGLPLRSLTLVTCATLTSLAVQFSFCLFPVALNSSCKQVCANAGAARTATASSAKINENVLQQLVRQLIIFLLLRRSWVRVRVARV